MIWQTTMRRPSRGVLSALSSILALISCLAGCLKAQIDSQKPLRIDLRTVNGAIAFSRSLGVVFLDDSTIAVIYTSDAVDSGSLNSHLATIDLSTSSLRQRALVALGRVEGDLTLIANGDHNLFVMLKQQATLFDADLRILKRQALPRPGLARVFPDRNAIVVLPHDRSEAVRRIDTRSLEVSDLQAEAESPTEVSDGFSARRTYRADSEPSLLVRARGEKWKPVALPVGQGNWCCGPVFVSTRVLVDGDQHGRLYWVDARTARSVETSMGEDHRSLKFIEPTPDGRRFAAVRIHWRWIWVPGEGSGRHEWRDGIQVYDVATRKPIFTKDLDVSWWLSRSFGGSVAISPSGNRLLVYDKTTIDIYALPPMWFGLAGGEAAHAAR